MILCIDLRDSGLFGALIRHTIVIINYNYYKLHPFPPSTDTVICVYITHSLSTLCLYSYIHLVEPKMHLMAILISSWNTPVSTESAVQKCKWLFEGKYNQTWQRQSYVTNNRADAKVLCQQNKVCTPLSTLLSSYDNLNRYINIYHCVRIRSAYYISDTSLDTLHVLWVG